MYRGRVPRSRQPALVEHRATITCARATTRIAVVSDTHAKADPRAAAILRTLEPEAILHGGDIGDLAVLDELATIAPVYAVRGNIDATTRGADQLADVQLIEVVRPDVAAPLRILLTHIALYGPSLRAEVGKRAQQAGAHLVVCGHSHVPFIGRDRSGIALFNPGSIGPKRFALPITLGAITLAPGKIGLEHWSCDTGAPWSP